MLGIFDSGFGGLHLAARLDKILPSTSLLYFGDTAHFPYGGKPAGSIIDRCRRGCEYLISRGARWLILACHTTSCAAGRAVREDLPFEIIEQTEVVSRAALDKTNDGRIGIIGSQGVIDSGIYQLALTGKTPQVAVHAQACPLLVPLVEQNWQNRRETKMILRRYLRPLKDQQIDTLIPACTHYQVLRPLIQHRIGRRVCLIDPVEVLTDHVIMQTTRHQEIAADSEAKEPPRFFITAPGLPPAAFADFFDQSRLELVTL